MHRIQNKSFSVDNDSTLVRRWHGVQSNRLISLYKEAAADAETRARALEGVVKSMEVHLTQREDDVAQNLQKQAEVLEASRKDWEEARSGLEVEVKKAQEEALAAQAALEADSLPYGRVSRGRQVLEPL